jgi:signal transduction histidine kinase
MSRWNEIRSYVRFGPADEEALRSLRDIVRPAFPRIVDEFYDRILEHEGARRVFTEGESQVARLKVSLAAWLESCFAGPWDDAYFQGHARIGRVHVRIGLEPRYVIMAMHLIRVGLQLAVYEALAGDRERHIPCLKAIAKICDVELAIILETFSEDYAAQLKRRERLAAIGQLGASISHEVKNPLGVIASSVYALRSYADSLRNERLAKHLDRIERNVDQANQIVTTLLDFLRTKAPLRVERDWNGLVEEAAASVHLPAGQRLDFALAPGAGRASFDPDQVGRVIANLVRNAAEAMPEGGTVTVSTAADRDAVEVLVRDRGRGVPSDILPQLFEPLFTTKQVGTGLGLALAKAIVEAHGGSIGARNAEGGGAEFRVRLPRGTGAAP